MLSLIVARARNGAIGRDGGIPWHAPEDLAAFQRETTGGALVMGRHTWDSLPVKPLKGRLNIVVTSQGCGAEHEVGDLHAAIALAHGAGYRRLYGIGGARIYEGLLPLADRLLVTEVALDVPEADTFFPEIPSEQWARVGTHLLRAADPPCELHEYLRKAPGQTPRAG